MFTRRDVKPGDVLYIVSIRAGMLLLGGRMTVGEIVSRDVAVSRRHTDSLYDAAEWVMAVPGSGTRLDLHRELHAELTKELRFVSKKSQPKPLFFVSDIELDGQTTRGVRELTPESARLLDRVIACTDRKPLVTCVRRIGRNELESGMK